MEILAPGSKFPIYKPSFSTRMVLTSTFWFLQYARPRTFSKSDRVRCWYMVFTVVLTTTTIHDSPLTSATELRISWRLSKK